MGKVLRSSLGGLAWSVLVVVATGCHSFEWVAVEDRTLAEAIFNTQPFHTPLTIEVESKVAKTCNLVASEGSPRAWIALRDATVAVLEPIALADGSSGCSLKPTSRSALTGSMSAWKPTESGTWRIPVGVYMVPSTGTFDSIEVKRSHLAGTIVFPWTFSPFRKMEQVVLAQTTASENGMKGQARAELARTADGWKVVSLEMKALQPR
jgi:hypothetical protein